MFSSRLPPSLSANAMAVALDTLRARGETVLDLTESNPTRAGLPYPDTLLRPLGDPGGLTYAPDPLGLWPARAAVAADATRRGVTVDPENVVLTASTSEAYAWLFKLLCDPGDSVLVPRPSYPLFDHLTRLESVEPVGYDLDYHGRWSIDFASIELAPASTRAVLVVSPNNPTGSFISAADVARLSALCVERGWALIADEVFADYALTPGPHVRDLAVAASSSPASMPLTFTLGGASKSLGLPQIKLGWIVVGGAAQARREAMARLELIADTYLSVSTPVQLAAATLLGEAAVVRAAIHARLQENLAQARALVSQTPSCDLLPVEGGWSAVLRVPATRSEERLVLELLERERVLVHPGYFFDFRREAYLIVSLLVPPAAFAEALGRVLRHAAGAPFIPANS